MIDIVQLLDFIKGLVHGGKGHPCLKDVDIYSNKTPLEKDGVMYILDENYEKQLRRLADFIGITISDEIIAAIAKKGNIKSVTDELGKNPKALEFAKRLNSDGKLPFYRKGIVGDWKNHFTVAQSEQADEIIGKGLEGSIFTFDYSI